MVCIKIATFFAVFAYAIAAPQNYGARQGGGGGFRQQQQSYQQPAQQQQSYSQPQNYYSGNLQASAQNFVESQAGMPYNFNWEVKAPEFNNDYSHQQQSDGTVTTGEYRILLPDSRTQIVRFTADANGYVADVTYEGTAQYSQQASNNQASYAQPQRQQQQQFYQQPQQQQQQYQQQASSFRPQQQSYQQPQQQYSQPQNNYNGRR